MPKFIGLYKVIEAHTTTSTVTLELPPELTARQVHPTFHMSLLRAHVPNDDVRFLHCDTKVCYDFGAADEPEWFVDEILAPPLGGLNGPGTPGPLDFGRCDVGAPCIVQGACSSR